METFKMALTLFTLSFKFYYEVNRQLQTHCSNNRHRLMVDVSVGVDVLLLASRDQHGDKFLQNFCPHLSSLKNLFMVHLLLPTVVQRHLQEPGLSRVSH